MPRWSTPWLWVALILLAALTLLALQQHGLVGIFRAQLSTPAGWQVLADLVIVCVLAMVWMLQDARARGRRVWPFLLLTLAAGAFGPLCYLLFGRRQA